MAEYYPLLARAVASLANPTPDARAAIYERARKALIGQLRSIDPPIAEADIERENSALDEAVARLEAEQAAKASPAPEAKAEEQREPSPPAAAPAESGAERPKPVESRAEASEEPAARPASKPDLGRPAGPRPFPRPDLSRGDRPRPNFSRPLPRLGSEQGPGAGFKLRPPRPSDASAGPVSGETPQPDAPSAAEPEPDAAPALAAPARPVPPPVRAGLRTPFRKPAKPQSAEGGEAKALDRDMPVEPPPKSGEPDAGAAVVGETGEVSLVPPEVPGDTKVAELGQGLLRKFGRARLPIPQAPGLASGLESTEPPVASEEPGVVGGLPDFDRQPTMRPMRPLAPQHKEQRPGRLRHFVVGSVVAIVVAGVAVAAWILRDRPEDLARHAAPVTEQADTSNKIIERIGVGKSTDQASAPAATNAAPAAAPAATPAQQAPAQAPAQTADQNAALSSNPPVPIAQRAALLVQAPTATNPQAVATYVGTVVWRVEKVAGSNGQPDSVAVRAEVDVPDAKLKASMVLSKNTDPTLPASHLIDLRFTQEPGSPISAVKQVDAPQMRREDNPSGDPLAGLARPVSDNYFLIALAQGDTYVSRNVDLLKTRGWFDVPMLLADNKIAKITFEKGPSGDRAIGEAIDAWSK